MSSDRFTIHEQIISKFPMKFTQKSSPKSLHLLLFLMFLMYSPRTAQLYFPLCLPSFSSAWDSLPFVSPLLDDAENNNRICWGSVRCWFNASNLGSEQESRASAYVLLFPVDSVDYQLFFFCFRWSGSKQKRTVCPSAKLDDPLVEQFAWQIFCKDPTLKICWNTSVLHCQHRYNLSKDNHFVWANWHYLCVPIVLIRTLGIFLLCRQYGSRCPKY